MASTPVRALHPAEKALRTRKTDTVSSAWVGTSDRPMGAVSPAQGMDQADADDGQEADDEDDGGQEKGTGALPQSSQVEDGDEQEDAQAHLDRVMRRGGKGRGEGAHAGGDGDGHRQGVVDDEGGAGQLADPGTEVVTRHGVGAATVRVGVDHLAVGGHQDDQEDDDGDGDGQDEVERGGARRGQDDQDGLGPIGHRGERVERERRQTFDGCDLLARRLLSRQRRARPERGPDVRMPRIDRIRWGRAARGTGAAL